MAAALSSSQLVGAIGRAVAPSAIGDGASREDISARSPFSRVDSAGKVSAKAKRVHLTIGNILVGRFSLILEFCTEMITSSNMQVNHKTNSSHDRQHREKNKGSQAHN